MNHPKEEEEEEVETKLFLFYYLIAVKFWEGGSCWRLRRVRRAKRKSEKAKDSQQLHEQPANNDEEEIEREKGWLKKVKERHRAGQRGRGKGVT